MARNQAIIRIAIITSVLTALGNAAPCYSQVVPSGYVPRLARTQAGARSTSHATTTRGIVETAPRMHTNPGPPAPPATTRPVAATQSVMTSGPIEETLPSPSAAYPPTPPAHSLAPQPSPVYADPMSSYVLESGPTDTYPMTSCDSAGCDVMGCDGGPMCGAAGQGACNSCIGPCDGTCGGGCYHWIDTLSLHVGVEGFKNGINRGGSGSFGFQEGVNWGSPWVFTPLGMNTQIGFRGTQTDFHGASFTTEHRGQYFVTAGFFKRNCQGWQGGIVFDYLHDDWYTTIDLAQLRGELSLGAPTGSSLGFAFAQSVSSDDTTSVLNGQTLTESWETQDYYTVFWEKQSYQSSYGKFRIFAGATGEADGIFGTQFRIPLYDNFSMESEFTYLIPNEGAAQGGTQNEAWNVALQLVWYPARSMRRANATMSPMFDVAGNGSMISRRK